MEIYAVMYRDRCDCGHASGEHIVGMFAQHSKALIKAQELNEKEAAGWRRREQEAIQELDWCLKNDTWVIPSGIFSWIQGYSCGVLERTHEELKKNYAEYIENAQVYKVKLYNIES